MSGGSSGTYSDFARARSYRDSAVRWLQMARASYVGSLLPDSVKQARIAALDAKIDAFRAIQLDELAHPWRDDGVMRPTA